MECRQEARRACDGDLVFSLEHDLFGKPLHTFPDHALSAEVLAQFQTLRPVVAADALAVERSGPRQHLLIDEAAGGLPVCEGERHLARAPLQHGARALPARAGIAKAGIEEAGIVDT